MNSGNWFSAGAVGGWMLDGGLERAGRLEADFAVQRFLYNLKVRAKA
jgi:hypothetical protein